MVRGRGFFKGLLTGSALGALTFSLLSSPKRAVTEEAVQDIDHDGEAKRQQVMAKKATKDFAGKVKKLLKKQL